MTLNSEVNIYFSASDLSDRHHSKSTKGSSTKLLLVYKITTFSSLGHAASDIHFRRLPAPVRTIESPSKRSTKPSGGKMKHRMERLANVPRCAGEPSQDSGSKEHKGLPPGREGSRSIYKR